MYENVLRKCAIVLVYCSLVSCSSEVNSASNNMDEEMQYFSSFSGYSLPLKLIGKISKEDALLKKAYYVGYYDESGKVYKVEKYFNGELFFKHEYLYHNNGMLKQSTTLNADGVKKNNLFDDKGILIE